MTNQNAAAIAEQIGDYRPQVGDEVKVHMEDNWWEYFTVHEIEPNFVNNGDGMASAFWATHLVRTASGITINEVQND